MVSGGTGNGSQLRRRSSRSPWWRPQSTSRRRSPLSRRNRLPVTVPVPPKKVRVADTASMAPACSPALARAAGRAGDHGVRGGFGGCGAGVALVGPDLRDGLGVAGGEQVGERGPVLDVRGRDVHG